MASLWSSSTVKNAAEIWIPRFRRVCFFFFLTLHSAYCKGSVKERGVVKNRNREKKKKKRGTYSLTLRLFVASSSSYGLHGQKRCPPCSPEVPSPPSPLLPFPSRAVPNTQKYPVGQPCSQKKRFSFFFLYVGLFATKYPKVNTLFCILPLPRGLEFLGGKPSRLRYSVNERATILCACIMGK